jgi:hypothetical protein
MLEEPYEGNLHVRICREAGWVTGRLYLEPDPLLKRDFRIFE